MLKIEYEMDFVQRHCEKWTFSCVTLVAYEGSFYHWFYFLTLSVKKSFYHSVLKSKWLVLLNNYLIDIEIFHTELVFFISHQSTNFLNASSYTSFDFSGIMDDAASRALFSMSEQMFSSEEDIFRCFYTKWYLKTEFQYTVC